MLDFFVPLTTDMLSMCIVPKTFPFDIQSGALNSDNNGRENLHVR